MQRLVGTLVLIGGAVGVSVMTTTWWPIVVGAGVVALAWPLLRCHHRGPLGLLPPVLGADGERVPARWYCDACGESWAAGITHESAPVRRYSGYDQTKAMTSARRASELESKQRDLAVKRSGAPSHAQAQAKKPRPVPFESKGRPEAVRSRLAG